MLAAGGAIERGVDLGAGEEFKLSGVPCETDSVDEEVAVDEPAAAGESVATGEPVAAIELDTWKVVVYAIF